MMKMSIGVIIACLLTLVALSSAFQELNSINELKKAYSEKYFPMHSIILLHWFANSVDIDSNSVVRVPFDPNEDFGSHCYKNYEGLLPSSPEGYRYCTVGNINLPSNNTCPVYLDFPEYVVCPRVKENDNSTTYRDRIIVRVPTGNCGARTVSEMYLTQHFRRQDNQGSRYDPDHTFRITSNLLQELRQFSFNDNSQSLQELRDQFDNNIDDNQLNEIVNRWGGDQAPLGLLYLIVLKEKSISVSDCEVHTRFSRSLETSAGELNSCEKLQIYLKVVTESSGQAKIIWRNLPTNMVNNRVAPVLLRNQVYYEIHNSEIIQSSEGSYESSVPLNEGLQVRLYKTKEEVSINKDQVSVILSRILPTEEICRGNEIKSPHAVPVTGYAKLQLFVRDGYACFRLYVKKGCDPWKSDFYYSWVGLYTSAEKDTAEYGKWQWATRFTQGPDSSEFDTFEYCTGTTAAPGLQARFMIDKSYKEKARTPEWRCTDC